MFTRQKKETSKRGLLSRTGNDDDFSINNNVNSQSRVNKKKKNNNITNKCCINITWKCLCLSMTLTSSLIAIIIAIIIFVSILPNFAQNTLNHATMDIINGTIYNPTNSSISLNSSIQLSNAGMFSAIIPSMTVNVHNNGVKIGNMKLPQLKTIANMPSIISVNTILHIENITAFKKSCTELLQNQDQKWMISASNIKLSVDTHIIGKMSFTVNLNKELKLPGIRLYDFIASDFNANKATKTIMSATANLDFIADSILTFELAQTLLEVYDAKDHYLGYAPLDFLNILHGHNALINQTMIVESDNNDKEIGIFLSNYIMNIDQNITIKGPVSRNINGFEYKPTVIDGILTNDVLAKGYSDGPLAFGSLLTQQSQAGWDVSTTGKKVHGAYANMMNPFNVPLRIVNMSGYSYLKYALKYDVTLLPLDKYHCKNTTEFAHLYIGQGIYKNNATKTFVDIAANDKSTFFVVAEPFAGSGERVNGTIGGCFDLYPFSCCFATLAPAYICSLNPGIGYFSDGELSSAYMPMELYSNITVLIDNAFKVNLTYNEPFFPVYFGYDVYAGYIGDAELSCTDYKFY